MSEHLKHLFTAITRKSGMVAPIHWFVHSRLPKPDLGGELVDKDALSPDEHPRALRFIRGCFTAEEADLFRAFYEGTSAIAASMREEYGSTLHFEPVDFPIRSLPTVIPRDDDETLLGSGKPGYQVDFVKRSVLHTARDLHLPFDVGCLYDLREGQS